ncbi:MAG: hypothetical protein WCR21_02440 [Bacteroidota bacterium]
MIEGLQLSIPKRMAFIKNILTVSLLVSVLSSLHLWCGERSFPHSQVWAWFYLTEWGEISLLLVYCLLLIASMFLRKQRLILFLSLLVASIFVLTDLNRLQPWFFLYNAMLTTFVFYNGRVDDSNKFTSYFIILQLIFASVYFFAGLNRFNSFFIQEEFTYTIAPLQSILSERHYLFFVRIGVSIPYLMVFIGLGLVITYIRYLAFALVVLFHLLLFFLMTPAFGNYNYPLWISQLVFILVALFLFSGKTKQRYFSPSFLMNVPLFYAVVIVFLILPFFTKLGTWPPYLTGDFKNYKCEQHLIKLSHKVYDRIPNYEKSFCKESTDCFLLDYNAWCLHELNSACFNEALIEKKVEAYVKQFDVNLPKNVQLALN